MMDYTSGRYIVFMLNPQWNQYLSGRLLDINDGQIFSKIDDAREYAMDAVKHNLCTRFVIGYFVMDLQAQTMGISEIETFGFKHDRKRVEQLELFQ